MQTPLQRPASIPEGHPLRRLFHSLTEASFEQVGLQDLEIMVYVTGLLIDFVHVDNLYRVRDAKGRRVEYLIDMQLESQQGDAAHERIYCVPPGCTGEVLRLGPPGAALAQDDERQAAQRWRSSWMGEGGRVFR